MNNFIRDESDFRPEMDLQNISSESGDEDPLESSLTEMDWLAQLSASIPQPEQSTVAITKPYYDGQGKPPFSYTYLISCAIKSSDDKKMSLSEIYEWISDNYPYYKSAGSGWKNSIRHNLSLNRHFIKLARQRDDPGKGSLWTLETKRVEPYGRIRSRKLSESVKTKPVHHRLKFEGKIHVVMRSQNEQLPSFQPAFKTQIQTNSNKDNNSGSENINLTNEYTTIELLRYGYESLTPTYSIAAPSNSINSSEQYSEVYTHEQLPNLTSKYVTIDDAQLSCLIPQCSQSLLGYDKPLLGYEKQLLGYDVTDYAGDDKYDVKIAELEIMHEAIERSNADITDTEEMLSVLAFMQANDKMLPEGFDMPDFN